MIVPVMRRAVDHGDRSQMLTDAAWQDLGVAFRAWASAPSRERYDALLNADRRWREAVGTPRDRAPAPKLG
jgi:hypothetical protein